MILYASACAKVGYVPNVPCPIKGIVTWYAYKDGKVKEFNNNQDASKFSKIVESSIVNKCDIDDWWDARKKLESKVVQIWHEALKEEFNDISAELYDACYLEAYERGHSSGYDGVAAYMKDYVDFVKKVRVIK